MAVRLREAPLVFAVGPITDQQRASVTFDAEMFVDVSTAKAIDGLAPDWRPDDGWRAHGLDPSLFSQGAIPMKYPEENHKHALEWFRSGTSRKAGRGRTCFPLRSSHGDGRCDA